MNESLEFSLEPRGTEPSTALGANTPQTLPSTGGDAWLPPILVDRMTPVNSRARQ